MKGEKPQHCVEKIKKYFQQIIRPSVESSKKSTPRQKDPFILLESGPQTIKRLTNWKAISLEKTPKGLLAFAPFALITFFPEFFSGNSQTLKYLYYESNWEKLVNFFAWITLSHSALLLLFALRLSLYLITERSLLESWASRQIMFFCNFEKRYFSFLVSVCKQE